MPKRDTQLPTSLFQADKSISGSPSRFRTSPATNFAPGDIFPDIRLSFVIVQGQLGTIKHTEQLRLMLSEYQEHLIEGSIMEV